MDVGRQVRRWPGTIPAVYSAVLVAVVAGPLVGSGYLLLRDAVSTPRSYLTDSALGLGDAAPRAVPQDALLAWLSPVVDGGVLVKAILLVALWAAGYGAAVLSRVLLGVRTGPQLVAVTVAVWNPYVAERLSQGHWSLFAGYAALPWTALAAYRLRTASPGRSRLRAWAALVACLAAAGLTPTGALLAGCVAVATIGGRYVVEALVAVIVVSAPWLAATVLSGAGAATSDTTGVAAFAARAEPGLGTLGSLAGLGGIWNGDAVPGSRTTVIGAVATFLLLGVVATGVYAVATVNRRDRQAMAVRRALLVLAAIAVVLPAAAATPWGMTVLEWLVETVPGAGLLRDTQKYVALAVPAYALCAAAGCAASGRLLRRVADASGRSATAHRDSGDTAPHTGAPRDAGTPSPGDATTAPSDSAERTIENSERNRPTGRSTDRETLGGDGPARPRSVAERSPERSVRHYEKSLADRDARGSHGVASGLVAALFIALLVVPLLDLGWGVGGALRPVHYPIGWQRVAEAVEGPGDVAVLPGGMFRRFPYSGRAAVLDPAPRMLPRDVLQTGQLPVRGMVVAGEGTRATEVEQTLLQGGSAQRLAELGVGWVLVERSTPGPLGESARTLEQLESVYEDSEFGLYRVPGARDRVAPETRNAQRGIAIGAHVLWVTLLVGGLLLASPQRRTLSSVRGRRPAGR